MWLLRQSVLQQMRAAMKAGLNPSAEQRDAYAREQQQSIEAAASPRSLRVAGDTAEIRIEGVLTKRPDFFAWLFGYGNTTYQDIQAAIVLAENDPTIKKVVFYIDSPGGNVDGFFDCVAAMESMKKPKTTRAAYACSAAFALACVGGKIEATNAASTVGSVGVVQTFLVDEEMIEITSTEAPNKRPDPSTPDGQAVIREYLDAVHQLFADVCARGRGTDVDTVNAEFGRGAVLLAGDAKKRKMIDSIAKPALRAVSIATDPDASASGGAPGQEKPMNLKELKAAHPELCDELRAEGTALERDRVGAHLTMGEQSGDMKTAIAAVKDGSAMTQTLMAQYMSAGMNRQDRVVRQTETDAAGTAADGAEAPKPAGVAGDVGDQAAALLAQKRGKKLNG